MPEPAIPATGPSPTPTAPGPAGAHGAQETLTANQTNDVWLKLITRYDFYYGSVNTKAALLIAFDTFVVGSIALKWADIQPIFNSHKELFVVECALMLALVATSLISLYHTFQAINPFLGSPRKPKDYHSLIFFGDVKDFQLDDYHSEIQKLGDADLRRDLAYQAHALAGGLSSKFARLTQAIWWVVRCQLPILGFMAAGLVYALAAPILAKIAQ